MTKAVKGISIIGTVENLSAKIANNDRFPITTPMAVLQRPIEGLNILSTYSTRVIEIYGWGSPIKPHVDGTGVMFFMPYHMDHEEYLVNKHGKVKIEVGNIYQLDDTIEHWTEGEGYTLSWFCGSFKASEVNEELLDKMRDMFSSN